MMNGSMWLLLLGVITCVLCAPAGDQVLSLPGLPSNVTLGFKHYSGYLVPQNAPQKQMHYWLVLSQNNPTTDPVVLWLNGGPGCSSLDGMLYEHGPFHLSADGTTVVMNPYAWNQIANVLYMESPVGVGYSYSSNPNDYITNDTQVALDNYMALQYFFTVKFPEFSGNDFYISGESYAGIYVPTLAANIQAGNNAKVGQFINLRGFAIGNGAISDKNLDNSLPPFAFAHGLLGDTMWNGLVSLCCPGGVMSACNFHNPTNINCIKQLNNVINFIYGDGINVYDIYLNCAVNNGEQFIRDPRMDYVLDRAFRHVAPDLRKRVTQQRKLVASSAEQKPSKKQQQTIASAENVGLDPPCINVYAATTWLNNPAVRTALHIPPSLPAWEICSDVVNSEYTSTTPESISIFPALLKQYRGLVYNGDVDMACNFLGDEWAVDSLNLTSIDKYRMWHQGNQVAGFVERFNSLVFLTVRGAGHMVPQWRPAQAYTMFLNFIADSDYP